MAGSSRKAKKNKRLLLNEGTSHFFKIILDNSIHKLGIPREFVQIYGDNLSSPVMLKVPSGAKWRVEIEKSEGEIWLQNGWREFAEYYSVVEGSFLVFEYEKSNCEFTVIIFDKTACEIDYSVSSFSNGDHERPNLDQEQVHQEPNKKKIKKSKTSYQYCHTGRQRITRSATKKKALDNEEKTNAVPKATSDFQSENPSFQILIRPFFFYKKTVCVIPQSFARKYLKENGDAALKVLDGTTWFVNYCSKTSSGITKTRIKHFDWKKFVQDNHLKVGDFCLFELIDHDQTTFRITKSIGNNKQSIKKKCRRKRKPLFPDRFEAEISSVCLRKCYVHVPSSFIKTVKQETKYLRLKVNNICWDVKLLPPKCGKAFLSAGWSAFSRDNSLKLGDLCTFQLISNTDETPLVDVSIMRKSDICLATNGVDRDVSEILDEVSGQCSSSRKRKEQLPLASSQPHKKMKNKVNEENFAKKTGKAKKKPYENPTFQMAIRRSHVHGGWSRLDIPAAFARKYIKKDEGHAVLNVLGGKTWTVECCRKLKCGKLTTALRNPDWKKFVRGNDLQIGHICIFKLTDLDRTIFEVIILKRRKALNLGKSKPSPSNPPEAARNLTLVNPSFQAVMTSRHLFKGGGLYVPRPFIENLEHVTQVAQLQVDNRICTRKLLIYPDHDKSTISGWVSFARENSLKVGDVCSFELIDVNNVVIKVCINRQ